MRRREFLTLAGASVAAGFSTRVSAQAQNWPDKPVKLILPYAPGGATDLIGRPWAEKLTQAFGQQFVIENRGGAGGMIGTEAASKAAPDGYTFLLTPNATLSVLPNMRKTPYDPVKSFDRWRASAISCAAS
jgi:tripartite-type tricarboxylate transporter receptor subunit TctC